MLSLATAASALVVAPSSRVVAIGDLHGDIRATVRTLTFAGIIDEQQRWAGGDTTLVQLGDILDRGDSEYECWTLLQQLKAEAPAAGGQVVTLCGNHEVMNVLGRAGPFIHALGHTAFGPDRVMAWAPGGKLAKQLAEFPVIAIVGDSVFVHAALPADATHENIEYINSETRAWLLGERFEPPSFMWGGEGSPIWDRCLSSPSGLEPHADDCKALRTALDRLGVARVVVGHTPQRTVNCACDGAVWRCDTGMSQWVVGGACEALEITSDGVRILSECDPFLNPDGCNVESGVVTPTASKAAPLTECDEDGCEDIFPEEDETPTSAGADKSWIEGFL